MASLFNKARASLGLYSKSSGYFPELTTSAGPESTGAGSKREESGVSKLRSASKRRKRKRRLRQQREEAARKIQRAWKMYLDPYYGMDPEDAEYERYLDWKAEERGFY